MSNTDQEWDDIRDDRSESMADAGYGVLRLTLLFGSVAVAFALFLVPILNRSGSSILESRFSAQNVDSITTASVPGNGSYVIRRSVLQQNPQAICVIRADGRQSGDC